MPLFQNFNFIWLLLNPSTLPVFFLTGQLSGSEFVELQGQHGVLRECVEQLRSAESSRATLVSHLREALQEQVGSFTSYRLLAPIIF